MSDAFRHDDFDDFESQHPNIVASKLALLRTAITLQRTRQTGRTVSVGAGTGSFEESLRRDGIGVDLIVEPSADLAAQSRARGFTVEDKFVQNVGLGDASVDTIFYNGSAFGFIDDDALGGVFAAHRRQLTHDGVLALLDVPPASALGIAVQASFDIQGDSYVRRVLRESWYEDEVPHKEYWRTTEEYVKLLRDAGFTRFDTWQTLRRHPIYQNEGPEAPVPGYREGSYVALVARP